MNAQAQLKEAPRAAGDSAKRRQIVEGARQIFLARGFDAASMSDIAREAGVSKGTLYVYFQNKEQLFQAIVHQECLVHAEGAFDLDPNNGRGAALVRLGTAYLRFLCRTVKASALRTVAAIADRMPEIGKVVYETGPAMGIARLAAYLQRRDRGRRAWRSTIAYSRRRNSWTPASRRCSSRCCLISAGRRSAIDRDVVGIGVRTFLRAYHVNPGELDFITLRRFHICRPGDFSSRTLGTGCPLSRFPKRGPFCIRRAERSDYDTQAAPMRRKEKKIQAPAPPAPSRLQHRSFAIDTIRTSIDAVQKAHRACRRADGHRAGRLHSCGRIFCATIRPTRLGEPRPLRAVRRPRLDVALCAVHLAGVRRADGSRSPRSRRSVSTTSRTFASSTA